MWTLFHSGGGAAVPASPPPPILRTGLYKNYLRVFHRISLYHCRCFGVIGHIIPLFVKITNCKK